MRVWITKIEEVDTGQVDGNGDPITTQRPQGLVGDGAWAQWPVVDADDTPHPNGWVVALAKDMDVAPTFGRDVGDPQAPAFWINPLPQAATELVETNVGLETGELAGASRAEVLRAITADEGAALGCTWGPERVGSRLWMPTTKQVRRFRRRQDRAWWDSLTQPQRNGIRALPDFFKDDLRDTAIADRAATLTWIQSLTAGQRNFVDGLTDEQKEELKGTPIADRNALVQSWV